MRCPALLIRRPAVTTAGRRSLLPGRRFSCAGHRTRHFSYSYLISIKMKYKKKNI